LDPIIIINPLLTKGENIMKRSILILLLSAFFIVALVPMVLAQHHKDLMVEKKIKQDNKLFKVLNLTDEQKTQISDLKLVHQKEMLPLRTELQGKMVELQLFKTEDKPDLKKIDNLIEEVEKIRAKMQKSRVRHQLEIRNILTPEQKRIFDSRTLQGPAKRFKKGIFGRELPGF